MTASIWLAWRELANRRMTMLSGVAMVAVSVGFCATIELISRAREAAVAAQIDQIGPALRLISAGKTAKDLARFELGSPPFTSQTARRLSHELGARVRAIEGRLVQRVSVANEMVPAIGIDSRDTKSAPEAIRKLGEKEVVLGVELARKLPAQLGQELVVQGTRLHVNAVLPETAGTDDSALFLSLERLQSLLGLPDRISEMRVFPSSGASVESIASYIAANHPDLNVINTDRGDTADRDMGQSLRDHRRVLYAIAAAVIALCIFVWSHLDASERRLEMATVVAIGGSAQTILAMLVVRAAIVAAIGAVIGYVGGAFIALIQDFDAASSVVFSWQLFLATSLGTIVLSVVGALPAAVISASSQPVAVLQEA